MQASQQIKERKSVRRASSGERVTAAFVCLGILGLFALLWLASNGRIDLGRVFGPCGFRQRYDLPCPTCGMTTSALAFVQGRIAESFYVQPAAALFCCVLVVVAFFTFVIAVFGLYFQFLRRFLMEVKIKHIVLILMIVIAAAWAVTLARALVARK